MAFTELPLSAVLCTLVASSLYSNISHKEGIKSIQEALAIHGSPAEISHISYIIEELRIVLENNF